MNENIQFLQAFLKNPGTVGSITPSSPELARRMVAGLKPDANNVVLELGVGTGAITRFLQDIVPDDKSYLGIELDRDLVRILKKNYPEMKIVRGNALQASDLHRNPGSEGGTIICCLPFVSIPNEIGEKILLESTVHAARLHVRTFQYAHVTTPIRHQASRIMRSVYGKSKRSPLISRMFHRLHVTWSTT